MNDAWGEAWGGAWGSSWAAGAAPPGQPEYSDLRERIAGDYWVFDEADLDIALDHRNFD